MHSAIVPKGTYTHSAITYLFVFYIGQVKIQFL